MKRLIASYINQLENVMDGDIWVGDTFKCKLENISASNAFTRPVEEMHSVAEILSHLVVWRESVMSVFLTGRRSVDLESPHNWKTNEELKEAGWEKLVDRFYSSQKEIVNFLLTKDDEWLLEMNPHGKHNYDYYVAGLIHHDLYHLGQVGIIKKFLFLSK